MNIKFKSTKDELPQHEQYILAIKTERSSYHQDTPTPEFYKCEWSWYDDDGGQLIHSDEYTIENPPEGYPFLLILDGEGYTIWTNSVNKWNPVVEHIWWISQKEFNYIWSNSIH